MSDLSKDELIGLLRHTVLANGNRPLGEAAFFSESGITRRQLWDAEIRSYGDLCELAGYERNRLETRLQPDQLFEPLARLTVQLDRFPDHTDRDGSSS